MRIEAVESDEYVIRVVRPWEDGSESFKFVPTDKSARQIFDEYVRTTTFASGTIIELYKYSEPDDCLASVTSDGEPEE